MYVVIVGAGEVGSYLAKIFVDEDHDVAVVEMNEELARMGARPSLDALVVHGSGVTPSCSSARASSGPIPARGHDGRRSP